MCIIILLWLLGGYALCWQAHVSTPDPNKTLETIKTAFLVLGGLGVVLPTYFNIWQSVESGKYISDRTRFDITENTYRMIEKFDDPGMTEPKSLCRAIAAKKINLCDVELIRQINEDTKLKDSVIQVFNYWENVRISIKSGRVNETLLIDSLASAFIQQFDAFKPWVDTRDEKYKNDVYWLKNRWSR
jgi:hypothetical protein